MSSGRTGVTLPIRVGVVVHDCTALVPGHHELACLPLCLRDGGQAPAGVPLRRT